jgi:MFS-type transporter involved in bile tolerance (Atg22 family)
MCFPLPFYRNMVMLTCLVVNHKGLNTTMTLVQICQNIRFNFAFIDYAYLGLVRGGASVVGQVMYWYIQRYWKLDSKKMARLLAVIVFVENLSTDDESLVHGYSHHGSCDPSLGNDRYLDGQAWVRRTSTHFRPRRDMTYVLQRYHNKWEFWVFSLVFGLFQAPWYSYSLTVMAELTPPGFDFMVRAVLKSQSA